jgi:hypothetical protein
MTYTKDELDNAYVAGQRNPTTHDKMSEETKQQFKTMGEDITNLKVSNAKIESKLDSLTELLKAHIIEEGENKKTLETILDKKAGIWVERVLIGAGSVVGVAILGSLLGLILIK